MASVVDVSPTPNPDAMKFTVDVRFDEMFNVSSPDAAAGSGSSVNRRIARVETRPS